MLHVGVPFVLDRRVEMKRVASAERLRERMLHSKHGWRARDLDRLYKGYGFEERSKVPHVVYFHPRYPYLTATVTRSSGALPAGYVDTALDLLDELDGLLSRSEDGPE
jgi:hypothetical protein